MGQGFQPVAVALEPVDGDALQLGLEVGVRPHESGVQHALEQGMAGEPPRPLVVFDEQFVAGESAQDGVGVRVAAQRPGERPAEVRRHRRPHEQVVDIGREDAEHLVPEVVRHQEVSAVEPVEYPLGVVGVAQAEGGEVECCRPTSGGGEEASDGGVGEHDVPTLQECPCLIEGEREVAEADLRELAPEP